MRDSRSHVETSGGRPQGRLQAAVRHCGGSLVRDQPTTAHAFGPPLPRRWARGPRAAFPPTPVQPGPHARRDPRPDRRPAPGARRPRVWTQARPPSPGTWSAKACPSRRPRPSGASCMPPDWSCPSRASARAAPGSGSRPPHPTRSGSPTSPTGASPTGREVEIISWLDDHSRYLLGCTAFRTGHRRRRGRHVHRGRRCPRLARRHAHRQRGGLHVALHRRPQRLRVPARLPRHPPEERGAGPPPDPGQDRALPPDPQALARAAAGGTHDRRAPASSSMPSASPTTSSGRTGRPGGSPRPRPTPGDAQGASRRSRRTRPLPPPLRRRRQARARSPCAGPAACTTSRSARPMPADASWPSSTSRRSRSSPSTPARSSRPTGSSPTRATGATHDETPADGRGPRRQADHSVADVATHVSHMSRLMTLVGARGVGATPYG